MGELITDTSLIVVKEEKEVALTSGRAEDLLIRWLNELIFLFDAYGFLGKKFFVDISPSITEAPGGIKLTAKVAGGIFDQEVNESRLLLKAATYHNLSIRQVGAHWAAEVIFDI